MKTRRMVWLILLGMLAACSAQASSPVQLGKPVLQPTRTTEITPVPLVLTPLITPVPLPGLPPLTDSQSSKMLTLMGDTLVTVNSDSDTITLIDITTEQVKAEIPVGDDPRMIAPMADTHVLVTLRGEDALALVNLTTRTLEKVVPVCHMPYGVVTNGRRAFVSCFADDQIAVLDLESYEVLYRAAVPDAPAGLVISGDWLLSTHFYSGEVTALNIQRTPVVVGSVNVETDGELTSSIILSPDGTRAFIPQTRTGLSLISLQYMQDWFAEVAVLDIPSMTGDRDARLTISMLDTAANMPFDAAFDASGKILYVVLAGSDAVVAIDTESRSLQARLPVGANPRGILVVDTRAYVLNALDGTVSVIDTSENRVQNTIRVTQIPLADQLWWGKVLFHRASAPVMSDGAISCATCHFDGGMDARTWINFRSGPRNTPPLYSVAEMPPYNWAGDMGELQDTIEDQIRYVMLGHGLITDGAFDATTAQTDAGRSDDLDALAAYVASLEAWRSPYREADGTLTASAQRGMQIFMSGSPNCGCHTPPLYTDRQQHNLSGAGFALEMFEAFDTPSLRGVWSTAPYMHDGVVLTLDELLTRTDPVHSVAQNLTDQQLDDLIAFLLSL